LLLLIVQHNAAMAQSARSTGIRNNPTEREGTKWRPGRARSAWNKL